MKNKTIITDFITFLYNATISAGIPIIQIDEKDPANDWHAELNLKL